VHLLYDVALLRLVSKSTRSDYRLCVLGLDWDGLRLRHGGRGLDLPNGSLLVRKAAKLSKHDMATNSLLSSSRHTVCMTSNLNMHFLGFRTVTSCSTGGLQVITVRLAAGHE
jgi:hypothetical protein